jgi:hypothetical protein
MDPLTALSVAGSVVQFADFGMKLFAEGRELYKSTRGILTANDELELVTVDFQALIVKVARVHDTEVQNQKIKETKTVKQVFGRFAAIPLNSPRN